MEVGPLVTRDIVVVGPHHSLSEAARRMNDRGVGSAVVTTDDGRPGIITERDLLKAMAAGVDPDDAVVEDYMTANPITASASWDVRDAARQMLEFGFRHLVVLGDRGEPSGIISIRDLVRVLLDERDR
jgi:CBS domain-containing protein